VYEHGWYIHIGGMYPISDIRHVIN